MCRQRTACRPAPFECRHRNLLGCRLGFCDILFQIGKLKFELIEQRTTFRGLSEPLVPQLLDRT
jgi:hypothetical protein